MPRPLPLVPVVLLVVLAGCGTKDDDVDKPPRGQQAQPTTLKQACPDLANAILATSPTAAQQVLALADTVDGISESGDEDVKNTLTSFPVDLRALAADVGDSGSAKTYAADVADIAAACSKAGAPFPTS